MTNRPVEKQTHITAQKPVNETNIRKKRIIVFFDFSRFVYSLTHVFV